MKHVSRHTLHEAGLTLVELVVVIAVMGLISGVVLAGTQAGEKQLLLDRTAHLVAQDIRRAMDYTMQARLFTDTCPMGYVFIGYGAHFHKEIQNDSYTIFANCRNLSLGEEEMVELERVELEGDVRITNIQFSTHPGGDPPPFRGTRITFIPPDPSVQIATNANTPEIRESVEITLQPQSDPSKTKTITVTNKGVIDIQ